MYKLITLDHFKSSERHYHVYKLEARSSVAEALHCHDYFQICYVQKGEVLHEQIDGRAVLVRGDAFIIPPGFVHSVNITGENASMYSLSFREELFYAGFSSSAAYRFLTSIRLGMMEGKQIEILPRVRLSESQRASMEALFACLLREFAATWSRDLTASGSIIAAIMLILAQAYFSGESRRGAYRKAADYSKAIEDCIRYLDQNYMYPVSMPFLLKQFAISRSSFAALFPKQAGMTLKQYVNQKRIRQALTLLPERALSLAEIAGMVGYDDFSTFYRNFRKEVGLSPQHYREQNLS